MALLMLTACGGGGGGSAEKTEEQKVMEKIGSQKNVHVTSDAELRAIAEAHLNEDLKIVWKLGNHAFVGGIYVNNLGDDLVITITAKYDYADTLLSDILTRLSNYIDTNVDASVNQSGTWSKVGVVVKRNETQSYVGRETSGGFLCLWTRQTKSSRVPFGRHAAAFALPAGFVTTQKGAGAPPLPTGTKKPRRAALQPHSGGKDEKLLFTCGGS